MSENIQSVIRARNTLAEMYADSEKRLEAALDVNEIYKNALKWLSDSTRYDKTVTGYARAALEHVDSK